MRDANGPGRSAARREELADGLGRLRARIADACRVAGRDPAGITLIAVTKTYPASDVVHLASLGVTDIGENRDQEAAAKAAAVAAAGAGVRWHFVGGLQRNKCRSVVRYADMVHSVDSIRLAVALGQAARRLRDTPLDVLVQVSLDGDPARGGAVDPGAGAGAVDAGAVDAGAGAGAVDAGAVGAVTAAGRSPAGVAADPSRAPDGGLVDPDRQVDRVAAAVMAEPALRLRGVMAVAPIGWPPATAFERLAGTMSRLRGAYPTLDVVSAGMSADLEAAINNGATHVRVGSALLGNRPPLG